MEVFPVFMIGIGVLVVGAVILTIYIAFKGVELP